VRVAIDFDEHETVRVVRLLDDIKAGNARFLDAVARVLECGLPERLDALRFHMNLDMDDQHDLFFDATDAKRKPGLGSIQFCLSRVRRCAAGARRRSSTLYV